MRCTIWCADAKIPRAGRDVAEQRPCLGRKPHKISDGGAVPHRAGSSQACNVQARKPRGLRAFAVSDAKRGEGTAPPSKPTRNRAVALETKLAGIFSRKRRRRTTRRSSLQQRGPELGLGPARGRRQRAKISAFSACSFSRLPHTSSQSWKIDGSAMA
jgi:hypothetical protein